jgi:hypothetical protein
LVLPKAWFEPLASLKNVQLWCYVHVY